MFLEALIRKDSFAYNVLDSLSKLAGILPALKQLRAEIIMGTNIPDFLWKLLCSECHKKNGRGKGSDGELLVCFGFFSFCRMIK